MRPAEERDIDFLVRESDNVFGEGYMTREEAKRIIRDPDSFLYMEDSDGEPAAALYVRYEDDDTVMEETGLTEAELHSRSRGKKILHSKFLFVREDMQKTGIAQVFLGKALDQIAGEHPQYGMVYGILWEYNGNVPVQKVCERNGYRFWKRLHMPYYKDENYYCIICKGRCRCDGLLYSKDLAAD